MSETKILIVEDELIVAEDLKSTLESLQYSISAMADSGAKAIEEVEKEPPDLVLMDIMLHGEMDGIEAAEQIQSRFHVPVVYLTAYTDKNLLKRARVTGAFGYVIKPFEEKALHTTIEIALYKSKMEKELRRAKEEAEEATKLKDKFVSLVAHDLRAPFSTILGFIKLIMNDNHPPLDKKHRDIVTRIISQGNRLMNLIQELLDVSRIKSGKITPKPRFLDGYFLGMAEVHRQKPEAQKKGIILKNEIPKGTRLYADETLSAQVLQNLLSNAIKFCKEEDTVTLSVPSDEKTTIMVKDTGMGVSEKRQDTLFEYEEHTSTTGTAGERGTGLGLPLSRDIMKAHGGTLDMASSPEEGSVFYARFPVVRPRVLVVDDDLPTRLMLKKLLKKLDLEISEASNGKEGLDLLATKMPHLIITDINMPEMDGFEMLVNIRSNLSMKEIPIIVLTAGAEEKTREEVFRNGANDFVNKPVDTHDFIARVRRFVG